MLCACALCIVDAHVLDESGRYILDNHGRIRWPTQDHFKGKFNDGPKENGNKEYDYCSWPTPECKDNYGWYRTNKQLFGLVNGKPRTWNRRKCIACPAGFGLVQKRSDNACPRIPCWRNPDATCDYSTGLIASKYKHHDATDNKRGCCNLASCTPCGILEPSVPNGMCAGCGCKLCALGEEARVEITGDNEPSASCVACASGYVRGADDMHCRKCGSSTEPNLDKSNCVLCQFPLVSTNGVSCELCDSGVPHPDLTHCKTCAANQEEDSVNHVCTACPANQYSLAGQSCSLCQLVYLHGRYTFSTRPANAASCQPCDPRDGLYRGLVPPSSTVIQCLPLPRRALAVSGDTVIVQDGTQDQCLREENYILDTGALQQDILISAAPGHYIAANGQHKSCKEQCSADFTYPNLCGSGRTADDGLLLWSPGTADIGSYHEDTLTNLLTTQSPQFIVDNYAIAPQGQCLPCTSCVDGQYNSGCAQAFAGNVDFSAGTCATCSTTCSPNHYLAAPAAFIDFHAADTIVASASKACDWTGIDIAVDYVPRADLICTPCPTVLFTPATEGQPAEWHIVVGCGNSASFDRWHPLEETFAGALQSATCHYLDTINCRKGASDDAGFFNSNDMYASVQDVLPYCPPGWHVEIQDEACPLNDEDELQYGAYSPSCCRPCSTCDIGDQTKKAADFVECSGASSENTQRCTGACGIGEYMVSDTDPVQCKRCTTCYDGEHAVTPLIN